MKQTKEMIDKLYDEFDAKKEAMIFIYKEEDGSISTYSCGKFEELASSIANIIDNELTNENIGEGGKFIANVIKAGVKAVLSVPSKAGKLLAKEMTSSLLKAMLLDKIGINTVKEASELVNGGDEVEDDENCEECNANKICPLPKAIKYRKENGITLKGKKCKKYTNENEEKGS